MSEQCCPSDDQRSEKPDAPAVAAEKLSCFQCGKNGKRVGPETIEAMVAPDIRSGPNLNGGFYFCAATDCDVVYFDHNGKLIGTHDLRVPVFQKDPGADVPACYCFNHTRRSIAQEIEKTGKSTVLEDIKRKVKEGLCACEIANPQGTCCLGNVSLVVKDAISRGTKP